MSPQEMVQRAVEVLERQRYLLIAKIVQTIDPVSVRVNAAELCDVSEAIRVLTEMLGSAREEAAE